MKVGNIYIVGGNIFKRKTYIKVLSLKNHLYKYRILGSSYEHLNNEFSMYSYFDQMLHLVVFDRELKQMIEVVYE